VDFHGKVLISGAVLLYVFQSYESRKAPERCPGLFASLSSITK
jgi:hypothetical protein